MTEACNANISCHMLLNLNTTLDLEISVSTHGNIDKSEVVNLLNKIISDAVYEFGNQTDAVVLKINIDNSISESESESGTGSESGVARRRRRESDKTLRFSTYVEHQHTKHRDLVQHKMDEVMFNHSTTIITEIQRKNITIL